MSVVKLLHKINLDALSQIQADSLQCNEVGEAEIETHKPGSRALLLWFALH